MKIANINNLSLVAIAMERLINRPDGLPGLGVLYGPSGYGKTTATVAVANSTQAYYVQLRSAWSKKTLLEKICFEMGIPAAKTTAANLDLICEQLAASQRPLILDEADYLVAKAGMVELVRDIYEGSQPDFNAQLNPVLKRAVAAVMACDSYEEADAALTALYPELDNPTLQRYMQQALFLSDLLGQAHGGH